MGASARPERTLVCELSLLDRADGSAKWSQDRCTVLAAVYGPRQAQQRKENCEQAIVEVVFKPRCGVPGPGEKEYEGIIREALEGVLLLGQFPRTSIMVVLQVLSDDGNVLATACNAACAALVDAGIPMNRMFTAVACAFTEGDGLLLEPDASEQQKATSTVVLSFGHTYNSASDDVKEVQVAVDEGALLCHTCAPTLPQPGQPQQSAAITPDQFLDAFELCQSRCRDIAVFLRGAVVKALS